MKYIVKLKTGKQFRAQSVEASGQFFVIKGTWEYNEVRLPAAEVERIWVPVWGAWDVWQQRGKILDAVLMLIALGLSTYLLSEWMG